MLICHHRISYLAALNPWRWSVVVTCSGNVREICVTQTKTLLGKTRTFAAIVFAGFVNILQRLSVMAFSAKQFALSL